MKRLQQERAEEREEAAANIQVLAKQNMAYSKKLATQEMSLEDLIARVDELSTANKHKEDQLLDKSGKLLRLQEQSSLVIDFVNDVISAKKRDVNNPEILKYEVMLNSAFIEALEPFITFFKIKIKIPKQEEEDLALQQEFNYI